MCVRHQNIMLLFAVILLWQSTNAPHHKYPKFKGNGCPGIWSRSGSKEAFQTPVARSASKAVILISAPSYSALEHHALLDGL